MKLASLGAVALAFTPVAALADHHEEPESVAPIEVMVLGVYHFDNPGLDAINIEVGDVLTPQRQGELISLTGSLADWNPTRILLEAQPDTPDLHMRSYRTSAAQRIAEDRNEHYQIGYRLAQELGHDDVYGFDERGDEGEPDYFPMQTVQDYAAENGMMGEFGGLLGWAQEMVGDVSADNDNCSIAHNLLVHNDPAFLNEGHQRIYYGMLQFGDAVAQPGAELNAYWYMRNAKMFAKVGLIAEPGDRVLIIVGSGHKYWLDHFASTVPGYSSVSPTPWLEAADDGRCNS